MLTMRTLNTTNTMINTTTTNKLESEDKSHDLEEDIDCDKYNGAPVTFIITANNIYCDK